MGNDFRGILRVSTAIAHEHRKVLLQHYGGFCLENRGNGDGNHVGLRVSLGEGTLTLLDVVIKSEAERLVRIPMPSPQDPAIAVDERRRAWNWLCENGAEVLLNWT